MGNEINRRNFLGMMPAALGVAGVDLHRRDVQRDRDEQHHEMGQAVAQA